jgi:4-carboxymuconolactone decarboxylase
MTRIRILDRSEMDAEQGRVYDEAKASGGPVGGPYYAYIRLPKLFEAAQRLRAAMSKEPLSRREQQIINLVVARHWNARYPWYAQVRASLNAEISQSVIDAINARATPDLPNAREKTCFMVASELLANKMLGDKTYADAEKIMGETDLIALVTTTGNFSTTCLVASAFEVDPPADNSTPLNP